MRHISGGKNVSVKLLKDFALVSNDIIAMCVYINIFTVLALFILLNQ